MPRITQLKIRNFKGFEALDVSIGPDGITRIAGPNESGKTSVIAAIRAAFEGAPKETIRDGKTKAEIYLETEALQVHRKITQRGTTVTVKDQDGRAYDKPGTMLRQLADVLAFRPLDLLGASDQVAKVAETLGLTITEDDLGPYLEALGYAGGDREKEAGRLLEMNPIEALRLVTRRLEESRRDHNRAAQQLEAQAEGLRGKVGDARTQSEVAADLTEVESTLSGLRTEAARLSSLDTTRKLVVDTEAEIAEKRAGLDDMRSDEQIASAGAAWFASESETILQAFNDQEAELKQKLAEVDAARQERLRALTDERERRIESTKTSRDETVAAVTRDLEQLGKRLEGAQAALEGARAPEVVDEEIDAQERRLALLRGEDALALVREELEGKLATKAEHDSRASALTPLVKSYRAKPGEMVRAVGLPIAGLDVTEDGMKLVFTNTDGKLLTMGEHAASRQLRVVIEIWCHRIRDRELKLICADGTEIIDEDQRPAFFSWLDAKADEGYHVFVTEATVKPGDDVDVKLEGAEAPAEVAADGREVEA